MNVTDILLIAVIALPVALAAVYVYRTKKKGKACIGCSCSSCHGSCSSCREGCHTTYPNE